MTSRMALVGLVMLALAAGACTPANSGGEDLEKKIADLTKRVEALEKRAAASGPPSDALENEALEAFKNVNNLMTAGKITEAKTALAEFNKKYAATRVGRQAQRMTQELSVIGKDAPANWGIEKWYQGEGAVSLDSGTTLLVFFEEWCPHCKREVPKLQQIYDAHKAKGLQVVGLTKVNRGATDEKVKNFISSTNVGYPVAKEDGKASQHFAVAGVPAAAVVKDGKIVWRGHPVRLTSAMLNGWL